MFLTGPQHGLRAGGPTVLPACAGEAPRAEGQGHVERPELRGAHRGLLIK